MNELHSPDLNPEELANLLDERLGDNSPESGGSIDSRIEIAIRLANAQHPQMSSQMLAHVQTKVLNANRQQLRRQRSLRRPQFTLVSRFAAAFAVVMVFFGVTAMPALANSVPGEFWYPFKRNLENVEFSFATSTAARADVYLTQAERRVEEAQLLLQRQVFDTDLILDARTSLANYQELAPELATALTNEKTRAAMTSESIAIVLQEAEQQQIISGRDVIALLPTVNSEPTNVLLPSSTPTVEPSATLTSTNSPTAGIIGIPSATPSNTLIIPSPTGEPSATITSTNSPTDDPAKTTQIVATVSPEPTNTETNTPFPIATATRQPPLVTMYVIENANVRNQPNQGQSVITILQQGTAIAVVGEDDSGKWWHIRLSDGRLGWVAKFLLSINKTASSAGNNASAGSNGSAGSDGNGDFGCDHSGNYCNAPGQTKTPPGQSGNVPTPHSSPDNSPNGNPPSNQGNGHKP